MVLAELIQSIHRKIQKVYPNRKPSVVVDNKSVFSNDPTRLQQMQLQQLCHAVVLIVVSHLPLVLLLTRLLTLPLPLPLQP
jgi:hypothetical protein